MPSLSDLCSALQTLPPGPVVQCAMNFSEGGRPEVIARIAAAMRNCPGVVLADCSADRDHNRMVATVLGPVAAVAEAALAGAREAVAAIDLRFHRGAHPRMGAVDVIPFTPVRETTLEECSAAAEKTAGALSKELDLPAYLYERSARPGRLIALPELRRGGFEGLFEHPLTGARAPDFGPAAPHPTAGAVVIGARPPLVAYNINLDAGDDPSVRAARLTAAWIRDSRESNPLLAGVRALGLSLPEARAAQVSMNLTRPDAVTLPVLFDIVNEQLQSLGHRASASEVIGLLPRLSLGGQPPERIRWTDYHPAQIIENWL